MLLPWILALVLRVLSAHHGPVETVYVYADPVDALSAAMTTENATGEVSYHTENGWSAWEELSVENEQDPSLAESNLILFPSSVTAIKTRGDGIRELHPIRVSDMPVTYRIASTEPLGTPKILTRKDWGADESLLVKKADSSPASSVNAGGNDDNGSAGSVTKREQDCLDAQRDYPAEFKVSPPVVRDKEGNLLRWPWMYSNEIKLLVVHHTAQNLGSDTRSGEERMRALYQYHASNRGWGDIGYHYVIGDDGQIYEGKAGGDFVVGGHAYCNNANTIGIAMMGNFDATKPAQAQMRSLQWLLQTLADRYQMDANRAVRYHGIQLPAIVGHKQLLSTDCPGEYVWRTLDQVRNNVAEGDIQKPVVFPNLRPDPDKKPVTLPADTKPARNTSPGFSALGATAIEGRPGGDVIVSMLYRSDKSLKRGTKIGDLWRSRRDLDVHQERDGSYVTLRGTISSPVNLTANSSTVVRLRITLPVEKGIFTVKAGDLSYTITSTGRRARGAQVTSSYQEYQGSGPSGPLTGQRPVPDSSSSVSQSPAPASPAIRIKLNDAAAVETVTIATDGPARVNAAVFDGKALLLQKNGDTCEALESGRSVKSAILKIRPNGEYTTLTSWKKATNKFRGTIECRIIDGQLTIINELPLEDYMMGLAEEPDTEPREKQRAFGIAARTYAAWYMDQKNRKFPGKPYDGSDSPAEFQVYGGMVFEEQNPRWVRIVKETANQVLLFGGQVIKPPYFSSDDGRTRSPAEAGWGSFPFASIYASKPDPWCAGMPNRGHGVGMSGCGAKAQAEEGKTGEEILKYYYPGTTLGKVSP